MYQIIVKVQVWDEKNRIIREHWEEIENTEDIDEAQYYFDFITDYQFRSESLNKKDTAPEE